MKFRLILGLIGVMLLLTLALGAGQASDAAIGSVHARFDLSATQSGPFPSNRFTVSDTSQNTGLRVELPKPDCAARPSDCDDIDVINELDGFNLQPRLSIPFDGTIDVASATSESVFLVRLGSTLPGGEPGGQKVGINQVVWDTFAHVLHVESDELLDQHTRYVLVVTKDVLDADGKEIKAGKAFLDFVDESNAVSTGDPALDAYRTSLRDALTQIDAAGVVPRGQVVAASLFTTQSVTAIMEKIRDQLAAATPEPADFLLGSGGERTVFPFADVASIASRRQATTAPTFLPTIFIPLGADGLNVIPGAIGTIAFGRFSSPEYETPAGVMPAVGTRTGTPAVQGTNEIYFNLFLPSGPEPTNGWPVVVGGHGGGGGGKNTGGVPVQVAAKLAQHGLATIAINSVGTGFGPLSTLTVTKTDTSQITLSAGGRNVDRNGDGVFDHPAGSIPEGIYTEPGGPHAIAFMRDGLRQTVVDLLQLVREIEVGMDADGDSAPDLDASRLYYLGNSLGGMYGTIFASLDPNVGASELGVTGGPMVEIARLNVAGPFRGILGRILSSRDPSLVNGGPDPVNPANPFPFRENLPLRNQPPVVNDVPGAIDIQEVVDRMEWAGQSGDPVTYAPHLRKAPFAGVPARPVLFTFAQGDRVLVNTTTATVLRAGNLADRTTFFRALDAGFTGAAAIHEFLVNLAPAGKPFALAAQEAVATFLASGGQMTVNPDGDVGQWFETPIAGPLPGELQ